MDSTKPKPFGFVLMPFAKSFDDVYELGVKAAFDKSGAYCERVDKQIFEGTILGRIYNQISKADFIVADMTGRNPNVFYEVGYAHALGKRVILVTKNEKDIPFDLKHYPHIIYKSSIANLKEQLSIRIKWFVANPETNEHVFNVGLELYFDSQNLSTDNASYTFEPSMFSLEDFMPDLVIHNNSVQTYRPGDFELTIFTSKFRECYIATVACQSMQAPDGGYIHTFTNEQTLFRGAYTAYTLRFGESENFDRETITIRIYTDGGQRDYTLTIVRDQTNLIKLAQIPERPDPF